jgi:hypothetical protein
LSHCRVERGAGDDLGAAGQKQRDEQDAADGGGWIAHSDSLSGYVLRIDRNDSPDKIYTMSIPVWFEIKAVL